MYRVPRLWIQLISASMALALSGQYTPATFAWRFYQIQGEAIQGLFRPKGPLQNYGLPLKDVEWSAGNDQVAAGHRAGDQYRWSCRYKLSRFLLCPFPSLSPESGPAGEGDQAWYTAINNSCKNCFHWKNPRVLIHKTVFTGKTPGKKYWESSNSHQQARTV